MILPEVKDAQEQGISLTSQLLTCRSSVRAMKQEWERGCADTSLGDGGKGTALHSTSRHAGRAGSNTSMQGLEGQGGSRHGPAQPACSAGPGHAFLLPGGSDFLWCEELCNSFASAFLTSHWSAEKLGHSLVDSHVPASHHHHTFQVFQCTLYAFSRGHQHLLSCSKAEGWGFTKACWAQTGYNQPLTFNPPPIFHKCIPSPEAQNSVERTRMLFLCLILRLPTRKQNDPRNGKIMLSQTRQPL